LLKLRFNNLSSVAQWCAAFFRLLVMSVGYFFTSVYFYSLCNSCVWWWHAVVGSHWRFSQHLFSSGIAYVHVHCD